jgi:hypothetical protein
LHVRCDGREARREPPKPREHKARRGVCKSWEERQRASLKNARVVRRGLHRAGTVHHAHFQRAACCNARGTPNADAPGGDAEDAGADQAAARSCGGQRFQHTGSTTGTCTV